MKILLDECVPHLFAESLRPHEAVTVKAAGFKGLSNGKLLATAQQQQFDAFVTVDKGVFFQHSQGRFALRIICVRAVTNRAADVLPYAGLVLDALRTMSPGDVRMIDRRRWDK